MAYYEHHGRQHSWDQSQAPNMSGQSTTPQQRDEQPAFVAQFEGVERAHENLVKSGKMFAVHGRRDSAPMGGQFVRQFQEFERGPMPPRHPGMGMGEYDNYRSPSMHSSSSVQGYLANQRFGPRQNDPDQMVQVKRRAAAQRERDLRNFHQEQQYNRNQSGPKSDRSLSPSAMSEEDRRDLIARQHRALYGEGSNLYMGEDGTSPRPLSQDARGIQSPTGGPGSAPLAFDSFGQQSAGSSTEAPAPTSATSGQGQRSRANSTSSRSPRPSTFAMFDNSQQANRTTNSSPGNNSPSGQSSTNPPSAGGVAPIGTRPSQNATGPAKRNTPPMPSSLGPGYGFGSSNEKANPSSDRSTPASANPSSGGAEKPASLGWGNGGGPWGSSKNPLTGVQASVWG